MAHPLQKLTTLPILISILIQLLFGNCQPTDLYYAEGKKFAISADHPLASEVGIAIWKKGGNAFDALVASSFAISVVRPQSTGIGGGGFALLYKEKDQESHAYDFRERAPQLAKPNMYLDANGKTIPNRSLFGSASVAVPGMVWGLWEIHKENGKLAWEEVLEPAIQLADLGFPAYPNLIESIQNSMKEMDGEMKKIFLPDGRVPQEKELIIQKDLARTLKKIQSNGYEGFYSGEIAEKIHNRMVQDQAFLRKKDLLHYQVKKRKPLSISYKQFQLESLPLPSSAVFLFQMFKTIENLDLKKIQEKENGEYTLLLVETMREAFLDRAEYGGDPDFTKLETEKLISEPIVQEKRERILQKLSQFQNATVGSPTKPEPSIPKTMESYNTTHISVVDEEGNVALSTHSINYIFGSRVIPEGTGVVLNDTMDDFASKEGNAYGLVGGHQNSIQPGKTPLSSMSPTIVYKNGKPWIGLGAPGGSFIFTSIFHTLLQRLEFQEKPYAAVRGARIHYQVLPDVVFVEEGWNPKERKSIESLYQWKVMESKAKVFYIEKNQDTVISVADPRGQGGALGH